MGWYLISFKRQKRKLFICLALFLRSQLFLDVLLFLHRLHWNFILCAALNHICMSSFTYKSADELIRLTVRFILV